MNKPYDSMSDFELGVVIERDYPFYKELFKHEDIFCEYWKWGCIKHFEQYDMGCGEIFYNAKANGKMLITPLGIAEMHGRHKDRILYKISLVDPDGHETKISDLKVKTVNKFNDLISGNHSYFTDYEVYDDLEPKKVSGHNVPWNVLYDQTGIFPDQLDSLIQTKTHAEPLQ